jgi:hypothetical protein
MYQTTRATAMTAAAMATIATVEAATTNTDDDIRVDPRETAAWSSPVLQAAHG